MILHLRVGKSEKVKAEVKQSYLVFVPTAKFECRGLRHTFLDEEAEDLGYVEQGAFLGNKFNRSLSIHRIFAASETDFHAAIHFQHAGNDLC
eukprot:CAMPEP_0185596106 /NCGR_PEP_ID=MMETSP0434-20130131/80564_1 /TAXON_ID=626734 ORGANISM="Favella taraikaensis, Strain Fe Narragansett Bay" /NCGR_SAMPLE_ID=MMETSP0434 /ASSEMBLY_ACC=CAM_ASM_000379 /LENGTH=91 /DNA_ID=CAMNT_0028224559 /DNA_START=1537 /DNA_END=1812 /DNA_ORIENTATION=+